MPNSSHFFSFCKMRKIFHVMILRYTNPRHSLHGILFHRVYYKVYFCSVSTLISRFSIKICKDNKGSRKGRIFQLGSWIMKWCSVTHDRDAIVQKAWGQKAACPIVFVIMPPNPPNAPLSRLMACTSFLKLKVET